MSVETTWSEGNEVRPGRLPDIVRLWGCDEEHRPITFMAESKEACPACEVRILRKMFDEETRHYADDTAFYRSIVHQIGNLFGDAAKMSDDGTMQESVLALRVFPLVFDLVKRNRLPKRNRRVRVHIRTNPGVKRKRRSVGASAALLIGGVLGFVVGALKGRND